MSYTRTGSTGILILLVISVVVNYIDRGALSVAAPQITAELKLSTVEMGVLFSAFFWSYASFQILGGWLVDRYPVRWVYAGGYFIWSIATLSVGLAGGLNALLLTRLFLGAGESVAYPACSKFLAHAFPEERRGFANALIDAGTKVGPALSILVGGLFVGHFGWRALFVSTGVVSMLWLLPWLAWTKNSEMSASTAIEKGPGWLEILGKRETWGTCAGMFALGYSWYFLLSWLPSYMVKERGLSLADMAVHGSIPFWVMAASSLASGWTSDRWIRAGADPARVRKLFISCGLVLCAAALIPAAFTRDTSTSLIFITLASLSLGLFTSNVWAATQTLSGPLAAGRWTAVQNTIGNLGGVISPIATGFIAQSTGSFAMAFVITAAVLAAGALVYAVMVPQIRPVAWLPVR